MSQPKLDLGLQNAVALIKDICKESHGRSQFFLYGGSGYKASVTHYFESSTEVAGGAVQPGSGEDLAKIFKVVADTNVKFAVKCGGHSTNPGFSSTTGIQIFLTRLNDINIDTTTKLVRVGAGCLFEELYQALDACEPKLNIVGGSGLAGVGLSGWMLGGGYSAKTSQYGLGVDNLESAKVALPDGTIKVASGKENEDLFFAIKGGVNNYGLVTEFTLIAHEQGDYYDHTFTFKDPQYFNQVKDAIYKILEEADKQANVEAAFRHYAQPGTADPLVTLTVHCVYDGLYPTPDPFGELKKIPEGDFNTAPEEPPAVSDPFGGLEKTPDGNFNTAPVELPGHFQTNSFLVANLFRSIHNGTYDILSGAPTAVISAIPETVRSMPPMAGIGQFPRGRWGNVMVDEFTPGIVDEIQKQAALVAKELGQHGGTRITIGFWPFTRTMFDKATRSAFPHEKGKPNCPIIAYFTWEGQKNDDHWITTMKSTLEILRKKVLDERPTSKGLPYMINTALYEATEVEDLYRDNLLELGLIRTKYDRTDVMRRTGGFRIPLLFPPAVETA